MGRCRCLTLVSLLLLVPSLFFVSPAAATAVHPDVVTFGGRRSLLQRTPPSQAPTAPAPPPATRTPAQAPTAPAPPPATRTPAQAPTAPAPPPATRTPARAPTAPAPPPATRTPTQAPEAPTPGAGPTRTPAPTPVVAPGPAPVPLFAPAPAPIGVTNSQRRNALIAGCVVGAVVLVAVVLIFCRCRCLKRSKRLPFQRLQMT